MTDSTALPQNTLRWSSLAVYLLLAYGFTWLFWLPQILASNGIIEGNTFTYICGFIAPFGPLVAALSVTYLSEKKLGLKQLFARGVK